MWSFRSLMPRRSRWRGIQFDTLRLRLIKLAARVVIPKQSIRLHLPRSMPDQAILGYALARLPRLIIRPQGHAPRPIPISINSSADP